MVASHVGKSRDFGEYGDFWQIVVKSPNVCKSVPFVVASHVGESGEYSDFGEFGEFLSNHQMYVNQFHTWWRAMLTNLANKAISVNMANSFQITKCM